MTERRLTRPVVGYRAFTVRGGGRLFSQYSDVEWPSFPGVTFRAKCEAERYAGMMDPSSRLVPVGEHSRFKLELLGVPEHEPPHRDCGCGIHAFYDVGSVSDATVPWEDGEAVFGLVVGWGEVVPHPDGFRCSHARICALAGTTREARAAAENCEVRLVGRRSELPDLAHLFGDPMPRHLVPEEGDGPSVQGSDHLVGGIV